MYPIIIDNSCEMDLNQLIRLYSTQPLTHQLLLSMLKNYKRPNDKINDLVTGKILEPIKRGIYIAGPALQTKKPSPFLMANYIVGPSYVSLESALSYYGLIPEQVFETSSMTTKASRSFNTAMGKFSYTHLPLPYYAFGISQQTLDDKQVALMASPEKALVDKLIVTAGKLLRSKKQALEWLLDDMRMDETELKKFNTQTMNSWIPDAAKKESLQLITKAIAAL